MRVIERRLSTNQSSRWLPPGDRNRLPLRRAVGQEVPQSVDTPDHFDVTVEKLGEAGGAGQDGSPSTDELAGGGEGVFERFPELIPAGADQSGWRRSCASILAPVLANQGPG